jgi:hypothetical protein
MSKAVVVGARFAAARAVAALLPTNNGHSRCGPAHWTAHMRTLASLGRPSKYASDSKKVPGGISSFGDGSSMNDCLVRSM